jgi:hypothetical protein
MRVRFSKEDMPCGLIARFERRGTLPLTMFLTANDKNIRNLPRRAFLSGVSGWVGSSPENNVARGRPVNVLSSIICGKT